MKPDDHDVKPGSYARTRAHAPLRALVAALLLALLLAACGAPPPPSGGDTDDVVVAERARIVDAETREALSSFDAADGTLVFDRSTAQLAALGRDDVLVSDVADAAPYGFLRTVVDVREEGGQVIVTTAEASLEDVIVEGAIDVREAITADDVGEVETLLEGVRASVNRATGVTRASLDDYLISLTFDRAVIDDGVTSVVLAGGLGIDLDFELVVDYGALRGLQEFRFLIEVEQRSELTLTSSVSGVFDDAVDIARIPLRTRTVMVGPVPVVLTYELFLSLAANGQLEAELVVGAAQTTEARLGASYVKDRSPNEWRGIAAVDAGFESLVDPELTVDAAARGAVAASASLLVYGIVGPNVGVDAFAEVEASVPGDPIWSLYGGIVARAGFIFEVPVFGRIVDFSTELSATRQLFLSAENTPPSIAAELVESVALFNRPLTLRATVSDLEDGTACCSVTWTSNVDGDLGATTGATPTLTHTFDSEGPRTITATAVDSAGASASATFDIDVVNPPPTAAVALPPGTIRAEVPSLLSALVSDPYRPAGGAALCNDISWSVPDATLVSAFGCTVEATFPAAGSYDVTITVTGAEGETATDTRTITVAPRPENIITITDFDVTSVFCNEGDTLIRSAPENVPFGLSASASDEQSRTLQYEWSYSYDPPPADGGLDTRTFTVIATTATAEHLVGFEIAGNTGSDVTFRLIVDDGEDGEDNEVVRDCSFFYLLVAN